MFLTEISLFIVAGLVAFTGVSFIIKQFVRG